MSPYLQSAILLLPFATLWYFIALLKKDNSVADIAWGLGFVLLAWWGYFHFATPILLCAMVSIWGLRLALHIAVRNLSHGEDWRYRKWREEWGRWFYFRSFLQVFLLQAFLLWVIAMPIMEGGSPFRETTALNVAGVLLSAFGFLYEAIADWQLARFKKDAKNKGKTLREGLWRFSRHPNYFGEILVWWGIFLYVFDFSNLSDWQNWLLILSPLTITFLLVNVSGVPMLESKYKGNEAYQKYVRETNALVPDFRKLKVGDSEKKSGG